MLIPVAAAMGAAEALALQVVATQEPVESVLPPLKTAIL
jgi:hypothetical protein